MKKPFALLAVILVALSAFSLYRAQMAIHRGELMWSFILLVMAVIFWTRSQRLS